MRLTEFHEYFRLPLRDGELICSAGFSLKSLKENAEPLAGRHSL